jgi:hypothetical protein
LRLVRCPRLPRLLVLLAAVALAMLSASAARYALPGLREKTRATPLVLRAATTPRVDASASERPALIDRAPAPAVPNVAPARLPLPRPPLRLLAPGGARTFDDDDVALGTGSLPKSERWKALGGHGRHGAG